MVVGVVVTVNMLVGMLMGVGDTVVGVLVGMGMRVLMLVNAADDVIVIDMHWKSLLLQNCFLYYTRGTPICQNISFLGNIPREGLRNGRKGSIISRKTQKAGAAVEEHDEYILHEEQEHDHSYLHAHGIPHSHGHVHENQRAVINRLARAIGHLEKVKRMVEEGHDCSEVLVQLAAVRSALDNTGKVILKDHMRHCMVDAVAAGDEEAIDDLCQAIDKFMK